MKRTLMLLTPLAPAACQTIGPTWNEVTGQHDYHTAVLYRRATIIERVDNNGSFPHYPIQLEPGKHVIEVQAPAPGWAGGGDLCSRTTPTKSTNW